MRGHRPVTGWTRILEPARRHLLRCQPAAFDTHAERQSLGMHRLRGFLDGRIGLDGRVAAVGLIVCRDDRSDSLAVRYGVLKNSGSVTLPQELDGVVQRVVFGASFGHRGHDCSLSTLNS